MRSFRIALLVLLLLTLVAAPAVAERNPAFRVPPGLRKRVDFWIDIFSRYGKDQAVIHHRSFPQVVYTVLDFSHEARLLNAVLLEKYKKKKIKEGFSTVQRTLKYLATGGAPRDGVEERIVRDMQFLGTGLQKYRDAWKDDAIRSQTGIREKYAEAISRSGRYLHAIEDIFVREFGLPIELTRLPFVESSFDYKAYSSVGAAGIWQFMRSTGKIYMTVNDVVDERRDVLAASRAAAKYLKSAYKQLGTWPLALTSYNHGVYGVSKKVKKLGTTDIVKIVEHQTERLLGFASSNFYPEFLAALEIYDDVPRYFPDVQIEPPLRVAQLQLPQAMSVRQIVQQIGIPEEELKRTNYALSAGVWAGRYSVPKGYNLKVPVVYSARLPALRAPPRASSEKVVSASSVYGGAVYTVRSGDTLIAIARRYNSTVADIRQLNGLKSDVVKVGQVLTVKAPENAKPPESARISKPVVKPKSASAADDESVYVVRSGDSLWIIGRKFNVSVDRLRSYNRLRSTRLSPGQSLKIP